MKCLSGRQPWWTSLLYGKGIENRFEVSPAHKQLKAYREPFLLHASKGVGTQQEFDDACLFIRERMSESTWQVFRDSFLWFSAGEGLRNGRRFRPGAALLRGGIIGRARVVGLITPDGQPYGDEGREAMARVNPDLRWHMRGQWGHILTDIEPLPFVPCKGALWLFDAPAGVGGRGGP